MSEPSFNLKTSGRSRRRLVVNRIAEGSALLAAALAVAALALVVWAVAVRGIGALSIDFFTKGPPLFGETGGGIAPAIAGSLLLVFIATLIALPIGVPWYAPGRKLELQFLAPPCVSPGLITM